jgi:hypothetical protein
VSLITGSADCVVAYEGLAVDDGRMPVGDLVPALLALADLTQEANAVSSVGAPLSAWTFGHSAKAHSTLILYCWRLRGS